MPPESANRAGSAEIAALIRVDIQAGRLHTHERLPSERELARQHGVARGTIRDALNQLAAEGLVDIRAGSGSYIAQPVSGDIDPVFVNARPLELIDARFALEPHLCRLAVLHARASDLDKLQTLLDQMETQVDDPKAFALADEAFHGQLAESTGNTLLIWMTRQIATVRNQDQWAQMHRLTLHRDIIIQYNEQHRAIFNAIDTREPERAASLMKEHLETARLSLTRAVAT